MARYCGVVGFSSSTEVETKPGVWEYEITERKYYGDISKDFRKAERSDKILGDISINNIFSIVADPFAFENFQFIRYLMYAGVAWTVESVEVQYPRLIISVGGRYNGPFPRQETGIPPETN